MLAVVSFRPVPSAKPLLSNEHFGGEFAINASGGDRFWSIRFCTRKFLNWIEPSAAVQPCGGHRQTRDENVLFLAIFGVRVLVENRFAPSSVNEDADAKLPVTGSAISALFTQMRGPEES